MKAFVKDKYLYLMTPSGIIRVFIGIRDDFDFIVPYEIKYLHRPFLPGQVDEVPCVPDGAQEVQISASFWRENQRAIELAVDDFFHGHEADERNKKRWEAMAAEHRRHRLYD